MFAAVAVYTRGSVSEDPAVSLYLRLDQIRESSRISTAH